MDKKFYFTKNRYSFYWKDFNHFSTGKMKQKRNKLLTLPFVNSL